MKAPGLTVVVRADLPPAQQAVQACHAVVAYAVAHPIVARTATHIYLLAVRDGQALARLLDQADFGGIDYALFREPDRGDELTAACFGPALVGDPPLLRDLPLALA